MHTDTNIFNYQAILHLTYSSPVAEIQYILKENEPFQEKIEIFNNLTEDYKVFMVFSGKSRTITLKCLILEKKYLEPQELKNFYAYAESRMIPVLNRIRFSESYSPQDVNYHITIKNPETGANIILASCEIKATSSTKWLGCFNKDKYEHLFKLDNDNISQYIDSYITIKQLSDPVLRLISAYQLYELIGESVTGKPIKTNSEQTHRYFEDSAGKIILKIELLAVATRNLVSHGEVNKQETIKALNNVLASTSNYHRFDRKNKNHMELVEESANKFLLVIKNYLKGRL